MLCRRSHCQRGPAKLSTAMHRSQCTARSVVCPAHAVAKIRDGVFGECRNRFLGRTGGGGEYAKSESHDDGVVSEYSVDYITAITFSITDNLSPQRRSGYAKEVQGLQ